MFSGERAQRTHKADITAICEPIVETRWNPQHLTTLRASTACYGDNFILLYVDYVRTSQETPIYLLWGYLYFLYVGDIRTSQEDSYMPPRPVTKIALLSICRRYSYLIGKTPIGLHSLLWGYLNCYVDDVRTSQETGHQGLLRV
jgi:hypothetical protein